MRRIGSIGIRSTINGRASSRQVFASPSFRQEAQNGDDDNENEDETRDSDSDCKIPLRKTNDAGIVGSNLGRRFFVDESVFEVIGFNDIQTAVDFNLEIFAVRVVQKASVLVKLKSLSFSPLLEQIFTIGITDWGLKSIEF